MTQAFSRSLRAIEKDGAGRLRWAGLAGALILGAWGLWMTMVEVPLFATSGSARIVKERAVHPIGSGVSGRVLRVHVSLDDSVAEGQLLFELDQRAEVLSLQEAQARVAALIGELATGESALVSMGQALESGVKADATRLREAELQLSRLELEHEQARNEAQRMRELQPGAVSEVTVLQAITRAETAGVAVEAQRVALTRLPAEAEQDRGDRETVIALQRSELEEKRGVLSVAQASVASLRHQLEAMTVRAPAAGRVTELAPVAVGAIIEAAQVLGVIEGPGKFAIEADFTPAEAIGRVRIAQPGELVLTGFPRAQFGSLKARVERVSNETRNGLIRVELVLEDAGPSGIPIEHGLPGQLRVEIERSSPAALVLRAAGGVLGLSRGPTDV